MDGDEGEDLDIEAELLEQLTAQRAALEDIELALDAEPSEELADMKGALQDAIAELQSSLLEIKRAALLAALETAMGTGADGPGAAAAAAAAAVCPVADDDGEGSDGGNAWDDDELADEGEEDEGEDGGGDEDGDEDDAHEGLGLDVFAHARLAAAAGAQSDTAHFATWEAHSRGIASRLMARMGYVHGTGLGPDGRQGSAAPLAVTMLPARQGLGGAKNAPSRAGAGGGARSGGARGGGADKDGGAAGKKRKRGGERARRRKYADESRAVRESKRDGEAKAVRNGGAGATPGMFSFINAQLGDNSEAAAKIKGMEATMMKSTHIRFGDGPTAGGQGKAAGGHAGKAAGAAAAAEDRSALVKQQSAIAACEGKVAHFKAMLQRNSHNSALARQVEATLATAQQELVDAQRESARMRRRITGKEAQKTFWGKF
ncbi:hypothetical protein FOA52_000285 [Chlamydomonas sp. UWO 241]|nr:hypothetical protein FOA52_000285 [Chlamydomonas sp. UWO 241]